MTDVSKRFEQLVVSTYKKFAEQGTMMPRRSEEGIWVGDVLIRSDGPYKDIIKKGRMLYESVSLNAVAIRLANLVAWNRDEALQHNLYKLDTQYSKHFIDSKIFLDRYHRAETAKDWEKAEIMWTRYEDAKGRAINTKSLAEQLAQF